MSKWGADISFTSEVLGEDRIVTVTYEGRQPVRFLAPEFIAEMLMRHVGSEYTEVGRDSQSLCFKMRSVPYLPEYIARFQATLVVSMKIDE